MTTPAGVVRGQDWKILDRPELGRWEPYLTVTVVLPSRDCQEELDRTLAALSRQTYPDELLEVVVVDDDSAPPLQLPRRRPVHTALIRLGPGDSHGSGRARHAGAARSGSDVLLFLDADVVPEHGHVEAHSRWHHLTPRAVVLGRKWFVDFAGITAAQVQRAAAEGRVLSLLRGRRPQRHAWQEDFIAAQEGLTQDTDDAFVAVVGATVSVRQDLYRRSGGFAPFDLRGIVDTEFGYRVFTSGGLLIPDDEARAYHQGPRNFASRGDEIKRERTGLAANYLPIEVFRRTRVGRQWAVPMVHVLVDARGARPEDVQVTIDSILASHFTDLSVTVTGTDLPRWMLDYFGSEARVVVRDEQPMSGFPSSHFCVVSPGLLLSRDSMNRALALLSESGAGVVRTVPLGARRLSVQMWRTRTLLRASWSYPVDQWSLTGEFVQEVTTTGEDLGLTQAYVSVSKQGMVTAVPAPSRAT